MSNINDFLAQIKIRCEAKAKEMNALELSVWNYKHECELKQHFGFTDNSLKKRKKYLEDNI